MGVSCHSQSTHSGEIFKRKGVPPGNFPKEAYRHEVHSPKTFHTKFTLASFAPYRKET